MINHMSKFALLCQAARLLGQVLHHVSNDAALHDDVWIQLDRTLQSMLTASLNVESPDHDQIAFVYRYMLCPVLESSLTLKYSALVALHAPWLCSDVTDTFDEDRSQRAKALVQQMAEKIETNLVEKECFLGRCPEDMSPWGLYFAYHICRAQIRSDREISGESELAKVIKETFLTIDVRWNAAGTVVSSLYFAGT